LTIEAAIVVFVGSLILSSVSSIVLADSPEISSAVIALTSDHHDLGVGLVIGSNIFNLVALLGLSAVVVGKVNIAQPVLLFDGTVALIVTVIMTTLILKITTPVISLILILALLIPYSMISSLRSSSVAGWRLPSRLKGLLCSLVEDVDRSARKDKTAPYATANEALAIIPALTSIILASYGMVRSAVVMGMTWNIPHIVLGTLILATLTGIPNVLAAIRLAQHNRGSAVVSETMNSNTLNVLSGICVPALVLGLGSVSNLTLFALWWLLGMTGLTMWLTFRRHGLTRREGRVVVLLYAVFTAIILTGI
jgi:cation:H+ antiporter